MNSLLLASYLWTQTRRLRKEDLVPLIRNPEAKLKLWQACLSNYSLKKYLETRPDWIEKNFQEIQLLQKNEISFSYWGQEDYLEEFLYLENPPLFYSYLGDKALLKQKPLAVVGSRSPSEASLRWMNTQFYLYLKENPRSIVSGAAIGIDQLAHKIACETSCPLITVLPSGLYNQYPKSYKKIINQVEKRQILLFSEYSLYDDMKKHYFIQRNRLIAALAQKIFIVEAKRRSGSLITARYAMDMGRDLYVLPSCPTNTYRLGTLDLMYDGAYAIRDAMDMKIAIP